jgi:hypothetical protein
MLEKFPGTTFLESDVEYCKRLLVSYNNLLLSRAICEGRCHSGRVCPTGTCRSRYASPRYIRPHSLLPVDLRLRLLFLLTSNRLVRLRSTESVDSGSAGTSKVSPGHHSSTYLPARGSESPANSPSKSPTAWERHYGCWKEHFRSRQGSPAPSAPNSTPASPVHYRSARKSCRSDSSASISSITSVTSLPAHLTPGPRPAAAPRPACPSAPQPQRKAPPPSPGPGPTHNRSCPPTPVRTTPGRRMLPGTGSGSPRGTPTKTPPPLRLEEDEDETMTVLLQTEPSTSTATANIWTTPTPSSSRLPSARPNTGITRWVMKRSAYRYD